MTRSTKQRAALRAAVIAAVFAAVASGIGATVLPSSTVASVVPDHPLTLRIGTNDGDDGPMAASIQEFVRQVDEVSEGSIVVEPVWRAGGEDPHRDWDQVVARMVE